MFGSLYTIPQGSNSTRWKMFVRFLLQMYEASFKPCKFSTSFPYITKSMNSSSSTTPFWFLRLFEKTVGSESSKGQPLSPWFYSTEKSPRHYIFEGFLDLSEGFPLLKTKKWRPIVPKYTSTYGFTTEKNQTQISLSKLSLFTQDPSY